ncbi:MAG: flagellar M-ring protein FliF [Desulfovibrio sp.]|nr:flagellar M-ring protein FliF [Desulfovibrio sp.]
MASAFTQYWTKIARFLSDRTLAQRILVGGLSASVILAFLFMLFFLNQVEYKVLYSRLSQEDASRVVEQLQAAKTPYKIQDNGTTILVPEDMVYEQRLRIAGEGVMHGTGIGFELFDELKVGQTDFVQHINYQRALQGELSRTIGEFPQVDKVRIHLVLPNKTLFIEEQRPASASVVLTLKQGERLDNKQLLGIVNLVAMSVEGLTPDHVTVTDTNGQVLYQPSGDSTLEGMTTSQLEYKNAYESNLENRLQQLLTPIVGPGRAMVKVNADLDFNQRTVRKETYDPDATVVRSEQRSEESTSGSAMVEDAAITTPGGGGAAVPNTNFRGDGFSGTESTQKSSRENRTTNYEINKEEQNIVTAMGGLNRQSIAVIVDGTYEKAEGSDVPVFTPRSAQELENIRALVAKAAGLNTERGDEIEVSSFEFGSPDLSGEPSLMETMLEYAQRLGKPFLNGLLIFLFLVLVVRPVVMALIRPRVTEEGIETLERLPEGEARMALGEAEEEAVGLEEAKRFELAKTLALQLFEENVEQSITVLKTWLKQEA